VEDARRIVAAFAQPGHEDAGVINLQGRMVERLHLAQAERLLAIDEVIRQRSAVRA
jgi:citrate lyase subunit beta/citryl-CoA lyase